MFPGTACLFCKHDKERERDRAECRVEEENSNLKIGDKFFKHLEENFCNKLTT